MRAPLLSVDGLTVTFTTRRGPVRVVDGVSFDVGFGEAVGLVGESGSGKSTTAHAIMRLLPPAATVTGEVCLDGDDMLALDSSELNKVRGARVAMVFQDPGQSLHPQVRIGEQIAEIIRLHDRTTRREATRRAIEMLDRVQIAQPDRRAGQYPHELSGGMQQRAMLAMALSTRPELLLADEPTTALDATIQAQILELLSTLRSEMHLSVMLISHDLALVSELCDRVVVLYAGQVVEEASTTALIATPQHPYTRALLRAIPHPGSARGDLPSVAGSPPQFDALPTGCRFHPRCEYVVDACRSSVPALEPTSDGGRVRCIRSSDLRLDVSPHRSDEATEATPRPTTSEPIVVAAGLHRRYPTKRMTRASRRHSGAIVVDGVDIDLHAGETVGLVGESGSGKSTTARLLLRLVNASEGSIEVAGRDVTNARGSELRAMRRTVQAVFQDAFGSLDPTMTVAEHLSVPLGLHVRLKRSQRRTRAIELLESVGLLGAHLDRYPHELSGGQRQRVVLARALAARPRAIVLDEPVSSLDVSTQSQAINLLATLQKDLGVAYLLIAHDLPLVRHLSHRMLVMYLGRIVEAGPAEQVYERPRHPYTQALLSSVPRLGGSAGRRRIVLAGEIPSPDRIPSGCRFRTRCPYAFERCVEQAPDRRVFADGGSVECHLHVDGPGLDGKSVDELLDATGAPRPTGHTTFDPAPEGEPADGPNRNVGP